MLAVVATETSAEQIGAAATLMSITLGVVSVLANQRANTVAEQEGNLGGFTKKKIGWDIALDIGLLAFGVALLFAAGPLFSSAAGKATPLLQSDTAFFALFCLVYLAVFVVVAWVGTTVCRRGKVFREK